MSTYEKGLALLLAGSLISVSSTSQAGTWRDDVSHIINNPQGSFAQRVKNNYFNYSKEKQVELGAFYTMFNLSQGRGYHDYKEDFHIHEYDLNKQFGYLKKVPLSGKATGSFKKGILRFANQDCNGESCVSYLYNLAEKNANKVPRRVTFRNKHLDTSSFDEKVRFLFHYKLAEAWIESGFFNTISKDGAVGYLQLMPCTAKLVGLRVDKDNYTIKPNGTCSDKTPRYGGTRIRSTDERFIPQKNLFASMELNIEGLQRNYWRVKYGLVDHNAGATNLKKYYIPCSKHPYLCKSKDSKAVMKESSAFVRDVSHAFDVLNKTYKNNLR